MDPQLVTRDHSQGVDGDEALAEGCFPARAGNTALLGLAALPHFSRASCARLFSSCFKYKHELRAAPVYLIFSWEVKAVQRMQRLSPRLLFSSTFRGIMLSPPVLWLLRNAPIAKVVARTVGTRGFRFSTT
jgi:hypothetical protein